MKMRLAALAGAVGVLAMTSCTPKIAPNACSPKGATGGIKAYGSFTPRVANGVRTTPAQIATEGRRLHDDVLRAEQNLAGPTAPERKLFADSGIQTLLTIRNDPQPGPKGKPTVYPAHTTEDLATFKTNLKTALKSGKQCLVAVENEEVGSPFVSGTASDYIAELKATLDVAHPMGIPVTNGGIVSGVSALLTWQDLFVHTSKAAADDYATRAFARSSQAQLRKTLLASKDGTLPEGTAADNLAKGRQLVAAYKSLPLDYVNFHWYIDDDQALAQTYCYFKRVTGHPVITHEIGQFDTDPAIVTGHLETLDRLGMPIVIWFDADGSNAFGLHDAPGVLRDNGKAFLVQADTN